VKPIWLPLTLASAIPIGLAAPAQADGCRKGAAVGGVAGHVAGHHGLLGGVGGCAGGHHEANKNRIRSKINRSNRRPIIATDDGAVSRALAHTPLAPPAKERA
jgi:hypothetical protein